MSSREIHGAIRTALSEVSRALASGELDRSGRYYSDYELKHRFPDLKPKLERRRARGREFPLRQQRHLSR